jgi:predicted phosphatase
MTYQDTMVRKLLDVPFTLKTLGPYAVPVRESDQMRCWGRSNIRPETPFTAVFTTWYHDTENFSLALYAVALAPMMTISPRGLIAYAFSWEWVTRYGSHLSVVISAVMLYFHLLTIKPRTPRHWLISATVISVLGSSLVSLTNYQRTGQLADELYMSELFAPSVRVSGDQSVEKFMSESAKLKSEVDAERGKIGHFSEMDVEGE